MEKTTPKTNLLVELNNRKMAAQKSGTLTEAHRKFRPEKSRFAKSSPVGPARGGRKGN